MEKEKNGLEVSAGPNPDKYLAFHRHGTMSVPAEGDLSPLNDLNVNFIVQVGKEVSDN
jgi:hypothetical protein